MISDGIDIKDINPIVNVGTAKNPLPVLCATSMAVLYEKATGKEFDADYDAYAKFCDKFAKEYNEGGFDTGWTVEEG